MHGSPSERVGFLAREASRSMWGATSASTDCTGIVFAIVCMLGQACGLWVVLLPHLFFFLPSPGLLAACKEW